MKKSAIRNAAIRDIDAAFLRLSADMREKALSPDDVLSGLRKTAEVLVLGYQIFRGTGSDLRLDLRELIRPEHERRLPSLRVLMREERKTDAGISFDEEEAAPAAEDFTAESFAAEDSGAEDPMAEDSAAEDPAAEESAAFGTVRTFFAGAGIPVHSDEDYLSDFCCAVVKLLSEQNYALLRERALSYQPEEAKEEFPGFAYLNKWVSLGADRAANGARYQMTRNLRPDIAVRYRKKLITAVHRFEKLTGKTAEPADWLMIGRNCGISKNAVLEIRDAELRQFVSLDAPGKTDEASGTGFRSEKTENDAVSDAEALAGAENDAADESEPVFDSSLDMLEKTAELLFRRADAILADCLTENEKRIGTAGFTRDMIDTWLETEAEAYDAAFADSRSDPEKRDAYRNEQKKVLPKYLDVFAAAYTEKLPLARWSSLFSFGPFGECRRSVIALFQKEKRHLNDSDLAVLLGVSPATFHRYRKDTEELLRRRLTGG